ncbi:hypothetical protein FB45DRAFT_1008577 [Roridomyces roridus]|uniref:Ricin B lectin domain-containing protein n=1 Tax=Roridomyces roridus TaxID=1738132 RepID=A0AAD7FE91_9AGAR|nr:hypothetical protein FB45DRAFT_1008577 [Roridomyces roridus]
MFPLSTATLILAGVFSGAVLASDVVSRRQISSGCSPNFQGIPVNIVYGTGSDGFAATSDATSSKIFTEAINTNLNPLFLVENSGHVPTSYLIKDQNNHELVVYAFSPPRSRPVMQLNGIDDSGQDDRQYWELSCTTCTAPGPPIPTGGIIASGCQIASSHFGLCVQVDGLAGTFPLLTACDGTNAHQRFTFVRGNL